MIIMQPISRKTSCANVLRILFLASLVLIYGFVGCGMNENEKILREIKSITAKDVANVEIVYDLKDRMYRIDAPPFRLKIDSSEFPSLCNALGDAILEERLLAIAGTSPVILEIDDNRGSKKRLIHVVYGTMFEACILAGNGETDRIRFYSPGLARWIAEYHAKLDIQFLASVLTLEPAFASKLYAYNELVRRLKKWLPFYDFSEFDTVHGNPAMAAKRFSEWYAANQSKLVWSKAEGHYNLQN